MADLVISGATVIDPRGTRRADVAVEEGRIVAVGQDLNGARRLDADGLVLSSGFVDLHTHLREPGDEQSETIESGARAAARGGYTAVLAMPNTNPAIDSPALVRQVLDQGRSAPCEVLASAAITVGREGERLAPMAELAALGVRWFTDDGAGVADGRLMRRALEYAAGLGVVLAQHCEDPALSAGGVMHEGEWSSRLGLAGQPAEAEELMVMRDIALARLTGGRVHFMHISTAGAVAMIRAARAGGLAVTAEATTHHLCLTDAACAHFDTVYKVHPPLRTEADCAAVRQAVIDGVIDCIATDHAPHAPERKERPFDQAPPGMLGLETAFAVANTELDAPLEVLLDRLSWTPARLLGIEDRHGGVIEPGRPANLTVIDPEEAWVVDPSDTESRSRNNPYAGRTLRGRIRHTLYQGEPVVIDGEVQR